METKEIYNDALREMEQEENLNEQRAFPGTSLSIAEVRLTFSFLSVIHNLIV